MIRLIAGLGGRGQVAVRAVEPGVAADVLDTGHGLLGRMIASFRRAPAFEPFDAATARAALDAYVAEQRERLTAGEPDRAAERRLACLSSDITCRLPEA